MLQSVLHRFGGIRLEIHLDMVHEGHKHPEADKALIGL